MIRSKFWIGRIIFLISVILIVCVGCSSNKDTTETESELQTENTEETSKVDLHIETQEELMELLIQPVSNCEAESLEKCDIRLSDADIREDETVLNFLILITDEEEEGYASDANVDALMILSLDKAERKMRLVSLERGMGVPVNTGEESPVEDDLMHILNYGNETFLLETMENVLKIDVNYFIRMSRYTLVRLMDEMGGVEIALTKEEASALNGEGISISKTEQTMVEGNNHMDGSDAIQYALLHLELDDTAFVQRQRNAVRAMIDAAGDLSILQLKDSMLSLSYLVRKNINRDGIFKLVTYAPAVLGNTFEELTLPLEGSFGVTATEKENWIYAVDYMENVKALHEFLYE